MDIKGIHHVSAITANAKENLKFYREVLGLRLVKKTVNQDEPSMYHLFYGDQAGNPGTELTFFEIQMAGKTHQGTNSISLTSLRVPSDAAIHYWKTRFTKKGISHGKIIEHAGRLTLSFTDFEKQRLMLVSDELNEGVQSGVTWEESSIPSEYGITGLGPSELTVNDLQSTIKFMTDILGFKKKSSYSPLINDKQEIAVFEVGKGGTGAEIHLVEEIDLPKERPGRGSVHHIALRVENKAALDEWVEKLNQESIRNSGLVNRFYFYSVYLTDPNGITIELATDGPGFAIDEPLEKLGENLSLPPFLEDRRETIERALTPLE